MTVGGCLIPALKRRARPRPRPRPQIFNEINSRRIKDEVNVFERVHRSPIFIGVILVTVGLQLIIMLTPMGRFFKVVPISAAEWGISVAVGAGSVLVSIVTRLITQWVERCFPPREQRPRARRARTSKRGGSKRDGGSRSGAEAELTPAGNFSRNGAAAV